MNNLTLYWFAAKTSILQQLAYRGELLLRNISLVFYVSIFIALWSVAYTSSGGAAVVGYRFEDMIWYLAMTESIQLARSRLWSRVSQDVKSGELAYKLARPYTYPLVEIATSLGNSLVRLVLNFLIAGLVAFIFTQRLVGSPSSWVLFGLMAVLGLTIDAFVAMLVGLFAFFTEEVESIFWVYDKILFTLGGLFIPLEVFPDAIRNLAEWLPLKTILYLPARNFVRLDLAFASTSLLQQIAVLAVLSLCLALFWPFCIRRVTIQGG